MIWLRIADSRYYQKDEEGKFSYREEILSDFQREYPELNSQYLEAVLENVHLNPSESQLREIIGTTDHMRSCILSPSSPSDYGYEDVGFFTEIYIKGSNFPKTTEQLSLNMPIQSILAKKVGLVFIEPKKTLESDYAGAEELKNDLEYMQFIEGIKYKRIASLFLFGVAGGGKSYFAECYAGTTGKRLAILDLPHFMTLPHPTRALEILFDVLSLMPEKFILFMDEMEKMFQFGGDALVAKQVLGKLLTKLNDIYADKNSNITFIGTANNITPIILHNPELLRRGRFDRLYFINYPSKSSAEQLIEVFKKSCSKSMIHAIQRQYDIFREGTESHGMNKIFSLLSEVKIDKQGIIEVLVFGLDTSSLIKYITHVFDEQKVSAKDSFVYTPPEISSVVSELFGKYMYLVREKILADEDKARQFFVTNPEFSSSEILKGLLDVEPSSFVGDVARKIIPLQISAKKGVMAQLAQSMSFEKGKELEQFINIS